MTDRARIRILVADDHELVRRGLVMLLRTCPEFDVVAEAEDGLRALDLFKKLRPDVALLDLRMPLFDGTEVVARLAPDFPGARFLVLTTYDTVEDVRRALDAGAHGYLLKGTPYDELVSAIKEIVERGGRRVSPELRDRVLGNQPQLTARELDVLRLMAAGRLNPDIAADLHITTSTVKNHITSVLAKLGVTTRTQAVLVAAQRGLVRVD